MMKALHLLIVPTLTLATFTAIGCRKESAQSEQVEAQTSTAESSTVMETAAGRAAAAYDLQFLDTMSMHHRGAIDMARMAQGKIEHAELKELVTQIPIDQQKEIDQMKSWRDLWYPRAAVAENTEMSGMSTGMNMDGSHMQTMKAGHDYDVMFIDMMVPHHESAVTMSRAALGTAEHQEIRTLAQQIIDKQTKEIDEMKKWKAALGKAGHSHKD